MLRPPNKKLPSWETLLDYLEYLPGTGQFVRKRVLEKHFRTPQACARYNTIYAGQFAGYPGQDGYYKLRIKGKEYLAHRVVWKWVTGEEPSLSIDHSDGDITNQRFENLSSADQSLNGKNGVLACNNTSSFTGVTWNGARWRARGSENDRRVHLGYYDTAEEAGEVVRLWQQARGYNPRHGTKRSSSGLT